MTVIAVIDASGGADRLDLVLQGWVRCGLVRPMAWGRLTTEATIFWRSLEPDTHLETRNEIINTLLGAAPQRDLHVFVVVASSIDDSSVSAVVDQLKDLSVTYDDSTRDPAPVPILTSLLVIPVRGDDGWEFPGVDALSGEWTFYDQFVVSPEDSPTPTAGAELGSRPLSPVAAHCLVELANQWTFAESTYSAPLQQGGSFQLVRNWTRIIDAGYVIDHIAARFPRFEVESTDPVSRRVSDSLDEVMRTEDLTADFQVGSLPPEPREPPEGWHYIVALLRYLLPRLPLRLFEAILKATIGPTVRRLRRVLRWIARKMGRPERPRTLDPLPIQQDGRTSILKREIELVVNSIERIRVGMDLETPPDPNEALWRTICGHVTRQWDSGKLSLDEAAGADDDSLLSLLAEKYSARRDTEQETLEHLIAESYRLIETDPSASAANFDEPFPERGWLTRLTSRLGWWLVTAALSAVALLLALLLPVIGLVFAAVIIISLLVLRMFGPIVWRVVRELGREFARRYETDWEAFLQTNLAVHRSAFERFGYRPDQVHAWGKALCAVARAVGQGPAMTHRDQGPFEPGSSPRAMMFSGAAISDESIEAIAKKIRATDGIPLFELVWNEAQSEYRDPYRQVSRFGTEEPLVELARADVLGLPKHARGVARTLAVDAVVSNALAFISGVVPWIRERSTRGIEFLSPPTDVTLGPIDRPETLAVQDLEKRMTDALAATITLGEKRVLAVSVGETSPVLVVQTSLLDDLPHDLASKFEHAGPLAVAPADVVIDRGVSGAALGGIGSVAAGAPVILANGAGNDPVPAIIEFVHSDGTFVIDKRGHAQTGAAVIHRDTQTLIGVVLGTDPVVVAGPIQLRAAILGTAQREPTPNELSPGISVPLDVLLSSSNATGDVVEPVPALVEGYEVQSIRDWFGVLDNGLQQVFPADIIPHSRYDDVDDPAMRVDKAVLQVGGGRLLVCSTVAQYSKPIPTRFFTPDGDKTPGPRGIARERFSADG